MRIYCLGILIDVNINKFILIFSIYVARFIWTFINFQILARKFYLNLYNERALDLVKLRYIFLGFFFLKRNIRKNTFI